MGELQVWTTCGSPKMLITRVRTFTKNLTYLALLDNSADHPANFIQIVLHNLRLGIYSNPAAG